VSGTKVFETAMLFTAGQRAWKLWRFNAICASWFSMLTNLLCRCNNVLWISGAKGAKQEETSMDG